MAEGNFDICLPVTLKYEGGKADNPADPGGRTNQGVTQRTYDGYRRGKGLLVRDVYVMEAVERDDIYRNSYWKPAGCETLAAGLDVCHFDGTVNSGRGNSARWLKSCGAVPRADAIHTYSAARLRSLESFRTWATFGKGWAARVAGVEAKAVAMEETGPATAKARIAAVGAKAAETAKAASSAAHGGAVIAGTAISAIPHHPAAGILTALVAVAGAVFAHFHASTSGARAAVLAHAAATL